MLKYMRKYAKSYLIKVLFAIIIIVFVFYFGAGSLHEKENLVAEVGPFEISYSEYWEAYSRELELYRQIYRDRLDDSLLRGLKEKVLDDMINQTCYNICHYGIGTSFICAGFATCRCLSWASSED